MALLDQFGNAIAAGDIARLREEISPPAAIDGRPPFQGHLAFGIDPSRLGAIIRAADTGESMQWMILAEEIEELFPHYLAVLAKRRRQVAQLPIIVKSADDQDAEAERHADFVRDWLEEGVLARAMFDVTDAIGKGYSVSEIVWDTRPGAIRPAEICYRPPRFFEVSWQDGATVMLRTAEGFADLLPHKFLVHTHRSKSGAAIRSGLTRAVAFMWLYSTYTTKDWALFCQAYGLPIRLGRYGPESSQSDRQVLWRAVSSIAGDVAAIIPKSMEMEFVTSADRAAGASLYEKRADWLNREVSKLVLGSTAGTEAIHGSHAVGQEHRQVEQDVEKFDAFLLETSITRQIIQPMIAFTFGPQERYPAISIGRPDEVPLGEVVSAIADLGGMGLKVRSADILDRLQLTPPEDGDETVGGVVAPPPQIPHPAVKPPPEPMAANPWVGRLLTRHAQAIDPQVIEALTDRLAQDAQTALAGLSAQVRHQIEQAADMHDLAHRLERLKLDPAMFALAMQRGIAVAQLAGQAALLDETRRPD